MGRNVIRLVVVLATFSVLGILLIQVVFLQNAVYQNEVRFRESVTKALKNVAGHLIEYNKRQRGDHYVGTPQVEVEQVSDNYYVVNVNDEINILLLEHFLIKEFRRHNLSIDIEYAVYDCEKRAMVSATSLKEKGRFRKIGESDSLKTRRDVGDASRRTAEGAVDANKYSHLKTIDRYTYYFGVYFPNRSVHYIGNVKAWFIINGIVLVFVAFLGYSLYIIIKQRRLSAIQKNFINNLTHEFKTPISAIDLSAKILADPGIISQPRRLEKYAGIIVEQTTRLSMQVEKVLRMASMDKKKIELDLQHINLAEFITASVGEYKNSQENIHDRIRLNVPDEVIMIEADILHLSNVVYNILDNAFKYCEGDPEITITVARPGKRVVMSFADKGIGIPRQYRRKIFNRFFRIPTGNVHNVKGFGLGLDYVRKVVLRHGWKISVSDNTPRGTIFTIFIPFKR